MLKRQLALIRIVSRRTSTIKISNFCQSKLDICNWIDFEGKWLPGEVAGSSVAACCDAVPTRAATSTWTWVSRGRGRKRRQHGEIQLHLGTIKKASIKDPKKRINNREIFANCCGTHTWASACKCECVCECKKRRENKDCAPRNKGTHFSCNCPGDCLTITRWCRRLFAEILHTLRRRLASER